MWHAVTSRWWWRPTWIAAVCQAFSALLVHIALERADAGASEVLLRWDGGWYADIAAHGYPIELPRDGEGTVTQNAWAFFPLYPLLVHLVVGVTGLPSVGAARLTSAVVAVLAACVLFAMLRERLGRDGASWAVGAALAFPSAAVLQSAYAEGLALLLLLVALKSWGSGRPAVFGVTAALLSLTRPVTLPLALVVVVVAVARVRRGSPVRKELALAAGAALWCCVCFAAWPLVAAVVTGEPSAYLLTKEAWRRDVDGRLRPSWFGHLVPPERPWWAWRPSSWWGPRSS